MIVPGKWQASIVVVDWSSLTGSVVPLLHFAATATSWVYRRGWKGWFFFFFFYYQKAALRCDMCMVSFRDPIPETRLWYLWRDAPAAHLRRRVWCLLLKIGRERESVVSDAEER